jgi:hypothetical protein
VLGDEEYIYGDSQFILAAVDVPVVSHVAEATREKPYLCVSLKIDLEMARQMISDFAVDPSGPLCLSRHSLVFRMRGGEGTTKESILPRYGMSMSPVTRELLDAVYRLLRLLSTPSDFPYLPPCEKRSKFVLKPLDF